MSCTDKILCCFSLCPAKVCVSNMTKREKSKNTKSWLGRAHFLTGIKGHPETNVNGEVKIYVRVFLKPAVQRESK